VIEIRQTETMGRGVFATTDIPAGALIGKPQPVISVDAPFGSLVDYVFIGDDGAAVVFGWMSLVNHGPANIQKVWTSVSLQPIASRDIRAGEQLFHDYEFEDWERPAWAR